MQPQHYVLGPMYAQGHGHILPSQGAYVVQPMGQVMYPSTGAQGSPGYSRRNQEGVIHDSGASHGVSPSESLPMRMESLLSVREQGSDNSDVDGGGEEEGPGTVTREMKQIAAEVVEQTSADREIKTDIHKHYDPNLVCPTCKKQFRIGEIQKYKRHAKACTK